MTLKETYTVVKDKIKEVRKAFLGFLAFIIIGTILLFIIPNKAIDPWGVINLWYITLILIVVLGIQFVAFIAIQLWKRAGLMVFGALVGFVNSNVINGSLASITKQNPKFANSAAAAIVLGNLSMLTRNLILVGALSFAALKFVVAPIGTMILVGLLTVIWTIRKEGKIKKKDMKLDNPFEIKTAIKFALVIVIITILAFFIHEYFGNYGLYATALISVFAAGVPIIVSSILLAVSGEITFQTAAIVVLIASIMSSANDFILQFSLGARALGRAFIKMMIPMVVAGLIVLGIEIILF